MHERCDACGHQFDVLAILFTGTEYLCPGCAEKRSMRSIPEVRRLQ